MKKIYLAPQTEIIEMKMYQLMAGGVTDVQSQGLDNGDELDIDPSIPIDEFFGR